MLDPDQLAMLKNRMLDKQQQLQALEETHRDATKTVELDQTRVGRLSRMDALQSQAMSLETQRRQQLELKNIAVALRRLDADDYGYCIQCDEEINYQRLEYDPATRYCIDCANKREQSGGV